ncbi:hypothetical protein OIDMADRAFT_145999 [Oidiodendron maius Zn]|uniref:Uncharacterized protein n=1 Tax=Oidiodendron maius (strain Zn) TaxID=913774 RepID=A0A0C3HE49_OIDMZ|nr:hypothetical protein OIDMADRAFT_145999 [Oidiodendron maius Zn]
MVEVYCAICGTPIYTSGSVDSRKIWLNKVILLTSAHESENGIELELDLYYPRTNHPRSLWSYHLGPHPPDEAQRRVLRLDTDVDNDICEKPYFKLAGSGKKVRALSVHLACHPLPPGGTQGGPIYLPVHRHCLHIADCFIQSVDASMHTSSEEYHGKITSIRQLWEVLYRRLEGYILADQWVLQEPHDYFGGKSCRSMEWEPPNDPPYGALLEENPVEIPNITKSILQNLEPIPTGLPTGLISNVQDTDDFQWVNNLRNTGLVCDYTYSQDWWCRALIHKKMLPWLWDIDIHEIRERQQSGNWNWELLARQLSQVEIHEPHDTTLKLPLGLRNRRRIWRILEEGRVDDVAEPEGRARQEAIEEKQRYWAIMHSQIQVPTRSFPSSFPPPPPPFRGTS